MKSKLYNVYFNAIKDREVIYLMYSVYAYSAYEAREIARRIILEKLGLKPYGIKFIHIEMVAVNEE